MARMAGAGTEVEIEAVLRQIEDWRQWRVAGQRMPEKLWEAAARLAAKEGVYPVARRLGLEYSRLKARVAKQGAGRPEEGSEAAGEAMRFESLGPLALLAAPRAVAEAVIELAGADGSRLTIRVPADARLDLGSVVASFWRRG